MEGRTRSTHRLPVVSAGNRGGDHPYSARPVQQSAVVTADLWSLCVVGIHRVAPLCRAAVIWAWVGRSSRQQAWGMGACPVATSTPSMSKVGEG